MRSPISISIMALAWVAVINVGCTRKSTPESLIRLCKTADEVLEDADVPQNQKGSELAERFARAAAWQSPELNEAFGQAALAEPGYKSKPIYELAEKIGMDDWTCPSLEAILGPPRRPPVEPGH